jgi:protein-L-isoaspartate(D-aspartate) O-methyltransferase
LFGSLIIISIAVVGFLIGPTIVSSINPISEDKKESNRVGTGEKPVSAHTRDMVPAFDLNTRKEHPPIADGAEDAFVEWMLARSNEEEVFLRARWRRSRACKTMYETPDLSKPRVIEAFLRTPREIFARTWNKDRAYENAALVIGWGQTISGPHMVSRMTEAIEPQPYHRVLEIGTGSGYQAAVLSQLSNFVYTIEIIEPLAAQTEEIFESLREAYPEYRNVRQKVGDGYYGWDEVAPFDRIIVTAGIDHIPPPLLQQLSAEGIMVIPVGPPSGQTVLKITKKVDKEGNISLTREDIYRGTSRGTIIFVPFTDSSGNRRSNEDR